MFVGHIFPCLIPTDVSRTISEARCVFIFFTSVGPKNGRLLHVDRCTWGITNCGTCLVNSGKNVKNGKWHLRLLVHPLPVQPEVQGRPEGAIIGHHVMSVNVTEGMIDMLQHLDTSKLLGWLD
jgi:hypothetical protein